MDRSWEEEEWAKSSPEIPSEKRRADQRSRGGEVCIEIKIKIIIIVIKVNNNGTQICLM